MKGKKLQIMIGLMTIAVIGLIGMQSYWLANLIRVEEERFHRTVSEVLRRVSGKIEQEEAAHMVIKKISGSTRNKKVKIFYKQSGSELFNKDSLKGMQTAIFTRGGNRRYSFEGDIDAKKRKSNIKIYSCDHLDKAPLSQDYKLKEHYLDTLVLDRNKIVQDVVTQITENNIQKKIEDRISTAQLDKLLAEEFRGSGLNGDFYFAVNKVDQDSLTLLKTGTDPAQLKKSDLKTFLFPSELLFNKNELIVYFPGKMKFILGSVAGMAGFSVALILVIIYVFYQTVGMFVRQKKLTQVKNDLINNITHEFKTPISTISLACEAIIEPGLAGTKEAVVRYSGIIKEENDRLKGMVDALLNRAVMEKGEFLLNKEKTDLHIIIAIAVRKFNQIIIQKKGKINLSLDAPAHFIECDPFHTGGIITNLIDNALKYNVSDPVIKVSTFNKGDDLVIAVEDNGIGIPKEEQNRIFETFYRVESGNIHSARGNGIGLSYVKQIVEEHGGSVSVKSETGRGSRFEIILPSAV
jgi:two-component system, OmpR family, phosphate regulon sensor histidine kinase PhoR